MNIPTNNILAMILCDGSKYNANGDDGYNVLVNAGPLDKRSSLSYQKVGSGDRC